MAIFKKKKKKETCQICKKEFEAEKWNFPIVWNICRSCFLDGVIMACEEARKKKEGEEWQI